MYSYDKATKKPTIQETKRLGDFSNTKFETIEYDDLVKCIGGLPGIKWSEIELFFKNLLHVDPRFQTFHVTDAETLREFATYKNDVQKFVAPKKGEQTTDTLSDTDAGQDDRDMTQSLQRPTFVVKTDVKIIMIFPDGRKQASTFWFTLRPYPDADAVFTHEDLVESSNEFKEEFKYVFFPYDHEYYPGTEHDLTGVQFFPSALPTDQKSKHSN